MDRLKAVLEVEYMRFLFNEATLVASVISTAIGTLISELYGVKNTPFMVVLVVVLAMDWFTGIRCSKNDGSYGSEYGIDGLIRTIVILALPFLGKQLDTAFMLPNLFFFMFWGGLVYHNFNSFTANCARLGWEKWIPNSYLEQLSSEIENKIKRSNKRKESDTK